MFGLITILSLCQTMSWQLHKHYATASVLQAAPAQRSCVCCTTCFTPPSPHSTPALPCHLTVLLLSVSCSPLFDVCNWHFQTSASTKAKDNCAHYGPRLKGGSVARPIRLSARPPVLFATLRNAVGHVQINGYFSTLCNLQTLSFSSLLPLVLSRT